MEFPASLWNYNSPRLAGRAPTCNYRMEKLKFVAPWTVCVGDIHLQDFVWVTRIPGSSAFSGVRLEVCTCSGGVWYPPLGILASCSMGGARVWERTPVTEVWEIGHCVSGEAGNSS